MSICNAENGKRKRIINPYTKCCRITNTAERGHVNIGTIGEQNCRQNPENRDCGQPFGNNFTLILQKSIVYQRLMPLFIHSWKMNQHEKMCLCTIHKKAHIKKTEAKPCDLAFLSDKLEFTFSFFYAT